MLVSPVRFWPSAHLLTGRDPAPEYTSGSGSVVEHLLAKEKVAGSNPVFRSIFLACYDFWNWTSVDSSVMSSKTTDTGISTYTSSGSQPTIPDGILGPSANSIIA